MPHYDVVRQSLLSRNRDIRFEGATVARLEYAFLSSRARLHVGGVAFAIDRSGFFRVRYALRSGAQTLLVVARGVERRASWVAVEPAGLDFAIHSFRGQGGRFTVLQDGEAVGTVHPPKAFSSVVRAELPDEMPLSMVGFVVALCIASIDARNAAAAS
ncbi:MAG: hypothetical protein R3F34_13985 [Planctomycetota bacterium]